MEERAADVCIVGAGYSGLTAAWRLHQAGRRVLVLEARERVGGRVWTEPRPDGSWIDCGGAWIGPGQDRIYALAAEMNVPTFSQYVAGDDVFELHGTVHRQRGLVPKGLGVVALTTFGVACARLDRMARRIPIAEPWAAPNALQLDAVTFEHWVSRWWNVPSHGARELLRMTMEGLFAASTAEMSLLHVLFHLHSAGGFRFQTGIENGAQHARLVGGSQAVLNRLVAALGEAVVVAAPVRAIAQDDGGVSVRADGLTVRATHVVVAVPPALGAQILYAPALPADRALLLQRMPAGYVVKIALVYPEAFWRADGLTGAAFAVGSPIALTIDGCAPAPPPGILYAFLTGPDAQRWARLPADERRAVVLAAVVRRFGPRAGTPVEYAEHCWADEPWSRGGFMTHFPPGVLTSFGPVLRAPVGRLHFAGTETAIRSNGFIDGAVAAGERAAAEVLAAA